MNLEYLLFMIYLSFRLQVRIDCTALQASKQPPNPCQRPHLGGKRKKKEKKERRREGERLREIGLGSCILGASL
jgi:hypothetical protein